MKLAFLADTCQPLKVKKIRISFIDRRLDRADYFAPQTSAITSTHLCSVSHSKMAGKWEKFGQVHYNLFHLRYIFFLLHRPHRWHLPALSTYHLKLDWAARRTPLIPSNSIAHVCHIVRDYRWITVRQTLRMEGGGRGKGVVCVEKNAWSSQIRVSASNKSKKKKKHPKRLVVSLPNSGLHQKKRIRPTATAERMKIRQNSRWQPFGLRQ